MSTSNTSVLEIATSMVLKLYYNPLPPRPSNKCPLSNRLPLWEFTPKNQELAKKEKIIQFIHFLAWFTEGLSVFIFILFNLLAMGTQQPWGRILTSMGWDLRRAIWISRQPRRIFKLLIFFPLHQLLMEWKKYQEFKNMFCWVIQLSQ